MDNNIISQVKLDTPLDNRIDEVLSFCITKIVSKRFKRMVAKLVRKAENDNVFLAYLEKSVQSVKLMKEGN